MDTQTKKQQTPRGFDLNLRENPSKEVKAIYDWSEETFGFVSNLTKLLSASEATLLSYVHTQWHLSNVGSLSPEENNVVQFTIAVENQCKYCTSGHTLAGKVFFGSADEDLAALRNKTSLSSEKFEALRTFAQALYQKQGRVNDQELEAFRSAGYSNAQALDVITNIAAKVISNFANQLAINIVDEPMQSFSEGLQYNESYR